IDDIPLNDKLAYELFQKGETTGVFQFESSGMKRYLRELKPTEFEDIIAMVALYRPGPMEWIPDYITGKHKTKKVSYLHPKLENILEKTYGVAIYQEQVMQIARDLAGFSMGEADVLRKAMGKKIASLLAEQKEKFVEGCVKNGVYKELGEKVFSFIEPFAGYGFNRSHAACYALIGYQTAYLKAHWPVEFMAALLTSDQHDSDRIAIEIDECRKMGLKIMAPNINESFASFTVVTAGTKDNRAVAADAKVDTIRFGLNAVKNVGEHIVEVIIKERKQGGAYGDIFNFLERITDKDLNKKSLESLIKSGALDEYGERGELLYNLEKFLSFNKEISKALDSRQDSLFNEPVFATFNKPKIEPGPAVAKSEKLAWEKELLGLYISEHPATAYWPYLEGYAKPIRELGHYRQEEAVICAGVIATIKKIITRKNESMLFVKIEDAASNIELLVFPSLLKETPALWQEGKIIICQGKISEKDQDLKLLVNRAAVLDPLDPAKSIDDFKKVLLDFKPRNSFYHNGNKTNSTRTTPSSSVTSSSAVANNLALKNKPISADDLLANPPLKIILTPTLSAASLTDLKNILIAHPGESAVYFKIDVDNKDKIIKTAFLVTNNQALNQEIKAKLGDLIKII
ncbi:MAG: DNA polymerase III subunit alpha, partial [Candidatus Falkowbacteria bacterium]|nr:DNA polymerase III subunit alpha [Candidatus Falkowbacteria bacterium]